MRRPWRRFLWPAARPVNSQSQINSQEPLRPSEGAQRARCEAWRPGATIPRYSRPCCSRTAPSDRLSSYPSKRRNGPGHGQTSKFEGVVAGAGLPISGCRIRDCGHSAGGKYCAHLVCDVTVGTVGYFCWQRGDFTLRGTTGIAPCCELVRIDPQDRQLSRAGRAAGMQALPHRPAVAIEAKRAGRWPLFPRGADARPRLSACRSAGLGTKGRTRA